MLLVLSAEVVGASMDATARFLQQGSGRESGRGVSVFQVRNRIGFLYFCFPGV